MLVLTRDKGQKILIGDDIVVTVVSVKQDGAVRIGIDAPPCFAVHREEVYNEIKRQEEERSAELRKALKKQGGE